jgi:hypothetical protein
MFDSSGNVYPLAAGPAPDGKSIFSYQKLSENMRVVLGRYDEKASLETSTKLLRRIRKEHSDVDIGFTLFISCMGRRVTIGDKICVSIDNMIHAIGNTPFIGYFSNGEIGAKQNQATRYNNYTIVGLTIFDKIMTE